MHIYWHICSSTFTMAGNGSAPLEWSPARLPDDFDVIETDNRRQIDRALDQESPGLLSLENLSGVLLCGSEAVQSLNWGTYAVVRFRRLIMEPYELESSPARLPDDPNPMDADNQKQIDPSSGNSTITKLLHRFDREHQGTWEDRGPSGGPRH
jgi:hypothetical protein